MLSHLGRSRTQTKRLENQGRVVVDGVGSGHLEKHHDQNPSYEPTGITFAKDPLECAKLVETLRLGLFERDLIHDRGELSLDIGVCRSESTNVGEVPESCQSADSLDLTTR